MTASGKKVGHSDVLYNPIFKRNSKQEMSQPLSADDWYTKRNMVQAIADSGR